MEEADGCVLVPVHDQEAVDRVEDAVVLKHRELGAREPPRVEVEEADVSADSFHQRFQRLERTSPQECQRPHAPCASTIRRARAAAYARTPGLRVAHAPA